MVDKRAKRFGDTKTRRVIKRRVLKRRPIVKPEKEVYNFLTKEEASKVKLPPKSERMVKAITNMNGYCVIAPANVIRQHITYDIMHSLGRIVKWRFLTKAELEA